MRMLGKGPTEMPDFAPSGHNTSIFAYPDTEHGRDVYYNEYGDLNDGECGRAGGHATFACQRPVLAVRWPRASAYSMALEATHTQTQRSAARVDAS